MASQGCQFDFDLKAQTDRLKAETPEWKPEWVSRATESLGPRTDWVRTDTESAALALVPLANVLDKAKELSGRNHELFVEHDPFAGLAKERPVRALAALTLAARRGDYPKWAWDTFLNAEARKADSPRMVVTIAKRLARLPDAVLASFVYPSSDWLLKASAHLFAHDRNAFERVWAKLISTLEAQEKAGASAIIQGNGEHDWTTEALNSPVGHMARVLIDDPAIKGLGKGAGLPLAWSMHADELLSLSGDPRRHALAIFSHQLVWLYHIDPAWTERALLSAINLSDDDAAAFWGGYFWAARFPQPDLYIKIKPALLRLARKRYLRRQHSEALAATILVGWGYPTSATGDRAISNDEMRAILIDADDEFRSQIIRHLDTWSNDPKSIWPKEALVFLREVWPKQIAAKTSAVSARLSELAFSHDDDFPAYVDAILPLVIAVNQDHMRLPMLHKSPEKNAIEKYPEKALELLSAILPDDARKWPYGMNDMLGRIGIAAPSLLNDVRLVQLNRTWNAR